MRAHSTLTCLLRENLLAVLGGSCTSKQLNAIVNLCVALALELLGRKSGNRKLSSLQGLNEKDLAYDSVADLFQRNEQGCFVQLDAYFGSFDLQVVSDEELLIAIRRLVYARVHQSLFRMYQDVDPVLSKILRNIKLAIQAMKQFDEVDRFGELCITPVLCDALEHLPLLDSDQIKLHLCSMCIGTENIPQMLGKLAIFLRQQECNSRIVPIMTVAAIFQSVYAIKNEPLLASPSVETNLLAGDTFDTIKSVCRVVKGEMVKKNVEKRKMSEQLCDTYFDVIESMIVARLAEHQDDHSYFDLLKEHLTDMTPAEYKKDHRSRLEYLGALTYKRVVKELKASI